MTKLRLYSRPDCHLCEEAEKLLDKAGAGLAVEVINIEDNLEYLHRYMVSIPVVQRLDTSAELGWPFDLDQLGEFLA